MTTDVKLKVGVIGIGRMGAYHVEKYAAIPDVELIGIADIDFDKARETAARFNTKAYGDYRELAPMIQAATVAVPTSLHYEVACDLLEAGVHLLVEKPLATNLEQIDKMRDIASRKGLTLMPGHVERFNAALAAVKKAISNPRFIEVHRLNMFTPRGTDVDVVLDLMIHDLDIVFDLVPYPVEEVFAIGVPVMTPRIDIANCRLHFGKKCVANLTASRVSQEVLRKIRIFQPNSYMSIDYAGQRVEIVHRKIEENEPSLSGETLDLQKGDALQKEIEAFIESVRNSTPPPVTVEHAREVLRVALAIIDGMLTADPDNELENLPGGE